MTNDQLPIVLEKARQIGKGRFACVGDISCDLEVRFTSVCTGITC